MERRDLSICISAAAAGPHGWVLPPMNPATLLAGAPPSGVPNP